MPDHDPIEELTRFGAELRRAGGDMPLSAADVRRRGNRIRRRRTALAAGGAVLAVAAVTTPILALTGNDGHEGPPVTRDPNRGAPLGQRDLLTDDDTVYSDGADWFATDTVEGDAEFQLCARESLTGLGATAVLQRTFELRNLDDPEVEVSGDHFTEAIAEFPDAARAAAAYDTIAAWVRDCTQQAAANGTPDHRAFEPRPVDPGVAHSEAEVISAQYGPAPKEIDPYGDAAYLAETGLVRVGSRLAVLDSAIVGQDYDFEDKTPVEQMVPVAAELLQPGDAGPGEARTTSDPSPDPSGDAGEPATTTIPDHFGLASGWPDPEPAGDMTAEGPSRDLPALAFTVCGQDVPDRPAPADRMGATFSQPEDGRSRQLSAYATEADATAAAASLVAAYRDCPEEGPGQDGFARHHAVRTGDLGDESWVLGTWLTYDGAPAIGIEVAYVVRVGTALLVITGSNEGGASDPRGDIATTASGMADDAASVVEQMCAFTATGC